MSILSTHIQANASELIGWRFTVQMDNDLTIIKAAVKAPLIHFFSNPSWWCLEPKRLDLCRWHNICGPSCHESKWICMPCLRGLDSLSGKNKSPGPLSLPLEGVILSLQDLIFYFRPPEDELEHEEKQTKLRSLRNRQNLFQEEVCGEHGLDMQGSEVATVLTFCT